MLLVAFPLSHLQAAENWDLCHAPSYRFEIDPTLPAGATRLTAQSLESYDENRLKLRGDVELVRNQQRIRADRIEIVEAAQTLRATGNVRLQEPNHRFSSPSVFLDDKNQRGSFDKPEFELDQRHIRGSAESIEILDADRSRYINFFYTACDPEQRDWHLRAREMEIDDVSGRGSAIHTTLYFKEVPFFYWPYFQFPIDDRRMSGILTPQVGYSDTDGGNAEVPVYWNLAPNYDMTITPAWYDKRGLQLTTENRYLYRNNSGELDLSYLDDEAFDDTRWFQRWRHRTDFGYRIKGELQLAEVSDADFFDDFEGIAPEYNDISHLDRHLRFRHGADRWSSELMWQGFQTLDRDSSISSRPYDRLPRLAVRGRLHPWFDNSQTRVSAEWVNFEREDSVTGNRSHLVSILGWRASRSWYFFEPELQLAFTDYRLRDNGDDNDIDRAIPTVSLDTGLIFERLIGSQGQWLQTLEPRLYFLSTPFEDQDEIPDFDTALLSETYNNLFRNNRFSGADRIGDAKQVTFGLASRVFDNESGDELLNMRAGRIFYFEDREVSLNRSIDESTRSNVIGEIDFKPNRRVKISSRVVYGEESGELDERDLTIHYKDAGFAANLGYYFEEEVLEQSLVSMVYPVNERWTLIAKYHHSTLFDKPVENLLGLGYESCCWGLKILASQTGDEDEDFEETDNRIMMEITLKGLSQIGQEIDDQLSTAIPGYKANF